MPRNLKAYGINNPLQDVFPEPVVASRAPLSTDTNYELGQQWVNKTTGEIWALTQFSSGAANWALLGQNSTDLETLTGDTGGALTPTAGNINILGGDLGTFVGSGSTLTYTEGANAYPITPYVVGPVGQAGYQTIQDAIDAVVTDAPDGAAIWVMPGAYTEDLDCSGITVLSDGLTISGSGAPSNVPQPVIDGTCTPPASGNLTFYGVELTDATAVVSSAAAGTATLTFQEVGFAVTNGYAIDVDAWTGTINIFDSDASNSTNDGLINNSTGTSMVRIYDSQVGAGTGQTANLNGQMISYRSSMGCPVAFTASTTSYAIYCRFLRALTSSGSQNMEFQHSDFLNQFTQSSTGTAKFRNCVFETGLNPALAGAGAGVVTLAGCSFWSNKSVASTLTIGTTPVAKSQSFQTVGPASLMTMSGTDLDASGTSANISITATPKGTGTFTVDSGGVSVTDGDVINSHSDAGTDVTVEVTNSDNTSSASRAGFEAAVGGTSSGDPYLNLLISGGQTYTLGIDNSSANDDLILGKSATVGASPVLTFDGSSDAASFAGDLNLATVATKISINGGADTDFIGQSTLTAGTVTVSNTNIAAGDRIFCTRSSINGSTALGTLVTNISAGANFTITAVQAGTPASTETNDVSIVDWIVFRQT